MNNLFKEFKDTADFLMVYIKEAHAIDEWPLGNHCVVKQHKSLEERINIAKKNDGRS